MSYEEWYFMPSGTGKMGANSMANPLRRTSLQPAEILVRESLANSFDERLEGSTLTFKVKRHKFVGEAKKILLKNVSH